MRDDETMAAATADLREAPSFPSYSYEECKSDIGGGTLQSIYGLRFARERERRRLIDTLAPHVNDLMPAASAERWLGGFTDCHHIFLSWTNGPSPSEPVAAATATWRHARHFRFLHLRVVAAPGCDPPGRWLGACLAEVARFDRNTMPAIVAIEAAERLVPAIAGSVADMGCTAIEGGPAGAPLAVRLTAAVLAAAQQPANAAAAGMAPAPKTPLCFLAPSRAEQTA